MSEKIWAPSNTGVLAHAFTRTKRAEIGALPMLVAACRSSITREAGAALYRAEDMHRLCGPCVKATERDAEYRARTAYYASLAEQQDAVMSQAVKPLSTGMVNALTGARPGLGNLVLDNSVRTGTCVALIERGLVTDLTTGKGAHVLTDEGFRVRGELLAAEPQAVKAAVNNTEPVEAEAQVEEAIETASVAELEESREWLQARLAEVEEMIAARKASEGPQYTDDGFLIITVAGKRYAVTKPFGEVPRLPGTTFQRKAHVKYWAVGDGEVTGPTLVAVADENGQDAVSAAVWAAQATLQPQPEALPVRVFVTPQTAGEAHFQCGTETTVVSREPNMWVVRDIDGHLVCRRGSIRAAARDWARSLGVTAHLDVTLIGW